MFSRSRSNLALWFTLTMGAVFAGVTSTWQPDDLEDLDRLLYKKNQSDGSEREV